MENLIGRKVYVYYNLHKKLWSIKCWKTKLVIAHKHKVVLNDCTFKVSQAGRRRVIKEQRKNVHAGILGTIIEAQDENMELFREVTYNPYKYTNFVFKDDTSLQPVYTYDTVVMENKRVFKRR